jgi:hypothetical protein
MRIRGNVDRCEPSGVSGWVIDEDAQAARQTVEVYLGEALLGRCVADQPRADLVAAGIGDGHVAFSLTLPPFLPVAALAGLRVVVAGSGVEMTVPTAAAPQPAAPAAARETTTTSRFGGLWIDRSDFMDRLGLKHRRGEIDDATAMELCRFVRDGYLVIPGAVPLAEVAALREELERIWADPPAGLLVETFEPDGRMKYVAPDIRHRAGATKLLDVYTVSRLAQAVTASPACMRFLSAVFEDTPKAFQQLCFWNGSQQSMHKDTAYVKIDTNPLSLAATWLALEDVQEGAGELEYYVGSHRAPDFAFGGVSKWVEGHDREHQAFVDSLHADAQAYGHVKGRFHGKAGDVLVWHADLAHGGSRIARQGQTRQSLVTHFTAGRDEPFYRRHAQHAPLERDGCVFVSQYAPVVGA